MMIIFTVRRVRVAAMGAGIGWIRTGLSRLLLALRFGRASWLST
jgi:hypothetical protein